jgi:hypothetical protein
MNIAKISKGLVLGLAVLLAASAFASNKGTLQLTDAVMVSGKQVPAGDYSVKWEGSGSSVQLSIMQGKNVVVTTTARVVDLSQSAENDSAVLRSNADGSKSLTEVRFNGKKFALAIGDETMSANYGSK